MRIFALNIRHGGGKRDAKLLEAVRGQQADVVVLTEFRSNPTGKRLVAELAASGFVVQADSGPRLLENGVLIAAMSGEAIVSATSCATLPREHWCRFAEVDLGGFRIGGVYFPATKRANEVFWEQHFHRLAAVREGTPYLFIGDFNSACAARNDGPTDYSGAHLTALIEAQGWVDAWRSVNADAQEATWVSPRGGGYRLDYAFASPRGPRIVRARHVAETRGEATDHAGLLIEVE